MTDSYRTFDHRIGSLKPHNRPATPQEGWEWVVQLYPDTARLPLSAEAFNNLVGQMKAAGPGETNEVLLKLFATCYGMGRLDEAKSGRQ